MIFLKNYVNLSLPVLLIGADILQVRKFCQNYLCKNLRSRQLFISGVHPDFLEVQGELEEIRYLKKFLHSHAQLAEKKIVLLSHAEYLNDYASNALLKTLEEPTTDTLFILLSTHVELLLPTIVSRCQVLRQGYKINTNFDNINYMIQDLQKLWHNKSISIFQLTKKWQYRWSNNVLYWLELTISHLIKTYYLGELQFSIKIDNLWNMLDKIKMINMWYAKKLQPNQQLMIELILLC